MKNSLRILCIGDIVGKPGRRAVKSLLPGIKERYRVDMTIANAENAAGGLGVTEEVLRELRPSGIDLFTTGNHVWDKKEIFDFIDRAPDLLRPANYPPGTPGKGSCLYRLSDTVRVGVINLSGRVFLKNLDCPFRMVEQLLQPLARETAVIIMDFHAEATSEKVAMGWFVDGKISAVVGTHTHVQTADERVLPGGTAYISDLGMTGPMDSVLGMDTGIVLNHFLTQLPAKFEVAKHNLVLQGAILEIDLITGKAIHIERISEHLLEN
ncbi:MAG: TIGR00282 family metallophosphoesterase [Syntrophothermus sp.]